MLENIIEDDNDVEMAFGDLKLLPEGEYIAEYHSHEALKVNFGGSAYKVKIVCRIISSDTTNGAHVIVWRNIADIKKRRITLSPLSKLTGELLRLEGPGARLDRVSMNWLRGKKLRLQIATVKTDRNKVLRHEAQFYSVVDSILGIYEDEEIPF